MRRRISKYFSRNGYRREFRSELRLLIVVTLGFTIGFTWRETIFDLSWILMQFVTKAQAAPLLSILASLFITAVSLGLIYLTSYFLKERPGEHPY